MKLNNFIQHYLEQQKHQINLLINTIELKNPLTILEKGYSLVTKDANLIKNSNQIAVNDTVNIKLYEGEIIATVKEKK